MWVKFKTPTLVHNKNSIYNYPCPGLEHVSSPWTWYQAFSWSKDFLENKKKEFLCLENWTWSSVIIPSCKCFGKEEEKLAFPSVFFQHLKCRPKAIVSRQENWMISTTVQLQPVWDPTAAFGYLAMQSQTKFQFKNFVMCATNVWAACSFVIRVPVLTI